MVVQEKMLDLTKKLLSKIIFQKSLPQDQLITIEFLNLRSSIDSCVLTIIIKSHLTQDY